MSDPADLRGSSSFSSGDEVASSSTTPILALPGANATDSTSKIPKKSNQQSYSDFCTIVRDNTKKSSAIVRRSELAKHGYRFRNCSGFNSPPMLVGKGSYSSSYYVHSTNSDSPGYKVIKMCFFRAARYTSETDADFQEYMEFKVEEFQRELKIARIAGEAGIGPQIHEHFILPAKDILDDGTVVRYHTYCVVMDYAGICFFSCFKLLEKSPTSDDAISILHFLRDPRAAERILELLSKISRAGILHNDLHTGNLMLKLDSDGYYRWFVVDYGCAEIGALPKGALGGANFAYNTPQVTALHAPMRDLLTLIRSVKSVLYAFDNVAVNYAVSPLFCTLAEFYIDQFCETWTGFGEHYSSESEALKSGMLTRVEFLSNVVTLSVEYLFDNTFIRPFSLTECLVGETHYMSKFDYVRLAKHFKQPEHACEWLPWRPKRVNVKRFLSDNDDDTLLPVSETKRRKLN
tara:strand:+ start:4439 stop:5824 length:1386 start_codon:yes stop_codon:yes gene_type:complete